MRVPSLKPDADFLNGHPVLAANPCCDELLQLHISNL